MEVNTPGTFGIWADNIITIIIVVDESEAGMGRDSSAIFRLGLACPEMPRFVIPQDFSSSTVSQIFIPFSALPWL